MATSTSALTVQQSQALLVIPRVPRSKLHLCPPTPEDTVKNAQPDTNVTLWRGVSIRRVAKMAITGSLSGEAAADANTLAPDEQLAVGQVGKGKTGGVKLVRECW